MELHNLIGNRLILPYLTGSFHPSLIEEYEDGLLMTLQKQDGGIHPILCGEIWCRYVDSLVVNETPVRNEEAKPFTSTYDNFTQTEGIRDGVSHYSKILSIFYDSLGTTNLNDPEVIIKIDISNVFNSTCRALTLDILSGRVSHDYSCGLMWGDTIAINETLSNMFGYFKVIRACHDKLRYFDWDVKVFRGSDGCIRR
jgi:hypothetical protein